MSEQPRADLDVKFMVDPYLNWVKAEGVPIIEGQALDLLSLELRPWARFGMQGAVCHVEGRCDFLTALLFELPAGAASTPVRSVCESVFYGLSGEGEMEVVLSDGATNRIAWKPRTLFAAPINATVRHRATGAAPARFVALSCLRYLMGLYRNEAFIFGNEAPLQARQARAVAAGLAADPLGAAKPDGELAPLPLADLSVGVDLTALDSGESTLARRQMQGRHILGVDGQGFSLSFASQTGKVARIDWRHGVLAGLAGMRFHQHFNAGAEPARFVSVELGSVASPMFRSRRAVYGDPDVYASGAAVVPRSEERAEVREALARLAERA